MARKKKVIKPSLGMKALMLVDSALAWVEENWADIKRFFFRVLFAFLLINAFATSYRLGELERERAGQTALNKKIVEGFDAVFSAILELQKM